MRYLAFVLVFLLSAVGSVQAAAHPSVGQLPNQVYVYPDQAQPSFSYGELTFAGPENLTPLAELSDVERYMLAGTATSPFSLNGGLPAWQTSVWTAVARIYSETGEVPVKLTQEVLKASRFYSQVSEDEISLLRNPITGDWPVLNAKEFSPGGVFIHPLTMDEMKHYAALSPSYQKSWFEGKRFAPENYVPGGNVDDYYTAGFTLDGPVWYIRMYGENGTILNTITYVGH